MKIDKLEINDLSDEGLIKLFQEKGYDYVWQQKTDAVVIGKLSDVGFTKDNLIEARIFSNGNEIHIFQYDEELYATECRSEQTDQNVSDSKEIPENFEYDHYFDEDQLLMEKYGKNITFRNFIGYEKDGQAYISRKILLRYE